MAATHVGLGLRPAAGQHEHRLGVRAARPRERLAAACTWFLCGYVIAGNRKNGAVAELVAGADSAAVVGARRTAVGQIEAGRHDDDAVGIDVEAQPRGRRLA